MNDDEQKEKSLFNKIMDDFEEIEKKTNTIMDLIDEIPIDRTINIFIRIATQLLTEKEYNISLNE